MSRYDLTEKIKKILEARGYGELFICIECGLQNKDEEKTCYRCGGKVEKRKVGLICKICECPLLVGEEIESKQQRRGKSKLYHAKCYDDSHFKSEYGDETDEEVEKFFSLPRHKAMSRKLIKKRHKRNKKKRKRRRERSK